MREFQFASEAETLAFGRRLAAVLERGDVLGLEGDLGAGKTFLIRGAIYALGLPEETVVPSPTFTLVQHYHTRLPVVHADLYRLGSDDELEMLGLREAMQDAVGFVEWGRRFVTIQREVAAWLTLTSPDAGDDPACDESRTLRFEPVTPRGASLLASLGKR